MPTFVKVAKVIGDLVEHQRVAVPVAVGRRPRRVQEICGVRRRLEAVIVRTAPGVLFLDAQNVLGAEFAERLERLGDLEHSIAEGGKLGR